jgi:magnesium chelatase subunit D
VTAFPFSALVGADALREALLVCAVDPAIGGVLVRGERGTAKSTAVRALAPLLPPVSVFAGSRYSIDPADPSEGSDIEIEHRGEIVTRPVRLVELPVGATADRVVGTLDLDRALSDGARAFEPGLLAAAHRGVLYVDEVNLLPDHLVDVLLDAAAMGRNHVEREGISFSHPSRFLLVGTMNPEEGELRPQLLDRFGLSVDVAASLDAAERVEVIKRRLAFDADPIAFAARFADDERFVAEQIAAARARVANVRLSDRMLLLIAGTCAKLGVDGLRADIVTARTATALAALDGATDVTEDHVRRAAKLALAHRRRRGPFEPPGLSDSELDDALNDADERPDDDPPPSPRSDPTPNGGQTNTTSRSDPAPVNTNAGPGPVPNTGPGPVPNAINGDGFGTGPGLTPEGVGDGEVAAPDLPGTPPLLELVGRGSGSAGRRSKATDGSPVDARVPLDTVSDLALVATLRAAAQRGSDRIERQDLREHVRAGREGNLVVFCVDASGSMGARRRMAAIKGAILGLLLDAYQRRDRVALVTFRGTGATLNLPPTSSVDIAAAHLAKLPTGGGTPLTAGLDRTAELIAAERRRDPDRRALALVVTDARTQDDATAAAQRLGRTADGVVVFDAEEGAVRLNLARKLADAAGARLLPLQALRAA